MAREYDILGDDGQAVVITIKNVDDLVAKQGGATGANLYKLTPNFVTNMVYDKLRQKLDEGLKAQGALADVKVVSTAPKGAPPKSEFTTGIAIGAGAVGVGWLLFKLGRVVFGRK